MIQTFGHDLAEDLFYDRRTKATRSFSAQLHRTARRKLLYLHDATNLRDLRTPPGNRLEKLKGEWEDFYSIRINDQWRLVFRWSDGQAYEVRITDYH